MNRRFVLLALSCLLLAAPAGLAQSLVTSGTVLSVSRADGAVTLLPDGSQRPVYFRDLHRARLFRASGRRATFDDFREGQPATVHYVLRDNRWYIGKVVVPDPRPAGYPTNPPSGLTTAEFRAVRSRAATDGDITTQPGTKARIDGDITTQPGRKDPRDPDITKRTDR